MKSPVSRTQSRPGRANNSIPELPLAAHRDPDDVGVSAGEVRLLDGVLRDRPREEHLLGVHDQARCCLVPARRRDDGRLDLEELHLRRHGGRCREALLLQSQNAADVSVEVVGLGHRAVHRTGCVRRNLGPRWVGFWVGKARLRLTANARPAERTSRSTTRSDPREPELTETNVRLTAGRELAGKRSSVGESSTPPPALREGPPNASRYSAGGW
jgi:hypothetical protein